MAASFLLKDHGGEPAASSGPGSDRGREPAEGGWPTKYPKPIGGGWIPLGSTKEKGSHEWPIYYLSDFTSFLYRSTASTISFLLMYSPSKVFSAGALCATRQEPGPIRNVFAFFQLKKGMSVPNATTQVSKFGRVERVIGLPLSVHFQVKFLLQEGW